MRDEELSLMPLPLHEGDVLPADTSETAPPVGGFRDGDLRDRLYALFPGKDWTADYFYYRLKDAELRACFVAADNDPRGIPMMGKVYDYCCGTTMAKRHGHERGRDRAPMAIPEIVMAWDDAKKAEFRAWKLMMKTIWDAEKEAGQVP